MKKPLHYIIPSILVILSSLALSYGSYSNTGRFFLGLLWVVALFYMVFRFFYYKKQVNK